MEVERFPAVGHQPFERVWAVRGRHWVAAARPARILRRLPSSRRPAPDRIRAFAARLVRAREPEQRVRAEEEEDTATITMILTTPFCPYGPQLIEQVRMVGNQVKFWKESADPGCDKCRAATDLGPQ